MQRFLLPLEYLEIQCYDVYGASTAATHCPFADHLRQPNPHVVRRMAGNAMNLVAVGSVLAFVLGCTARPDHAAVEGVGCA